MAGDEQRQDLVAQGLVIQACLAHKNGGRVLAPVEIRGGATLADLLFDQSSDRRTCRDEHPSNVLLPVVGAAPRAARRIRR